LPPGSSISVGMKTGIDCVGMPPTGRDTGSNGEYPMNPETNVIKLFSIVTDGEDK